MYLIHETKLLHLPNILKSNFLFKSSIIQKYGLNTLQGFKKRRLSNNPKISLTDSNFGSKYDEVDGVYFRLIKIDTPIKIKYGGDCILIFSKDILYHNNFVINTEENFGFCIAEDGVVAESQFSGEKGMSVTSINNLHLLNKYNFDPYSTEVLIMNNVNLINLKCIFIKSKLVNNKFIEKNVKNIQLYTF